MKRLLLIPMLFVINLAFSQKIDCNKLTVTNLYFNSTKDSLIDVSIFYTDTSSKKQLNYPGIKSVTNKYDNYDTLSAKIGNAEYYVQFGNTEQVYHLKYKKMPSYKDWKVLFVYNDLLGQTGENTCLIDVQLNDTLECKYVEINKDTVTINFQNNTTDLSFKYKKTAFENPNFEYISNDSELEISDGKYQSFVLSSNDNDYSCIDFCSSYNVLSEAYFSTTATETKYLKGKFVIGSLDKTKCYFDIVYKVVPPVKFYPNPFIDVINFEINNLNFVIYNVLGQNVLEGVVTDKKINTSSLNDDIYILVINGKSYKILKDSSTPTSIDIDKIQNTCIYPNPFENVINIKQNNTMYSICDILGNVVVEGTINDNRINTESLNSGVYILEIEGVKHKVFKE